MNYMVYCKDLAGTTYFLTARITRALSQQPPLLHRLLGLQRMQLQGLGQVLHGLGQGLHGFGQVLQGSGHGFLQGSQQGLGEGQLVQHDLGHGEGQGHGLGGHRGLQQVGLGQQSPQLQPEPQDPREHMVAGLLLVDIGL
uniref:Uncharacterized protein n=1 Tax=Cacopsylla melanoneura TaxID=428564 RepID=A0A8D9A0H7_9HEMI